jgi:hypothetical protein
LKSIIDSIFNNVQYWQDKNLLLQAIPAEFYNNKAIMLGLLEITSLNVSVTNEAKKDMWNHQIIHYRMGDDILKNINSDILDDKEFAKAAIGKYNRTYIFLSNRLKASKQLALLAAKNEIGYDDNSYLTPILKYMPKVFQADNEIALSATTRNIENFQYATNLQRNKYFIIDIMNLLDDTEIKHKVLKYMDQDLLNDKRFVSKLGCFDNLCERFHNDTEYVAHAVMHDIKILKKTKIFDESIISSALKNKHYPKGLILASIFRYIERFNSGYDELDTKIKNKKIIQTLFWELGETVSDEFI